MLAVPSLVDCAAHLAARLCCRAGELFASTDDNNAAGGGNSSSSGNEGGSSSRASSSGSSPIVDTADAASSAPRAAERTVIGSNLSVPSYIQILQDSRRSSWPMLAQKIQTKEWIELSQLLVQPPFDAVRQVSIAQVPWMWLCPGIRIVQMILFTVLCVTNFRHSWHPC
jgi:hypothetical protein